MDRLACVDIPLLALQCLRRERDLPAEQPLAVVDRDHPDGRVQQVNRAARRARIRPDLRLAAALQLCPDLVAAELPEAVIRDETRVLIELLGRFSPHVEADATAGRFVLDARGVERLFGPVEDWARAVHEAVDARDLVGRVAVASSRFTAIAIAATRAGVTCVDDPADEQALIDTVPLRRVIDDPTLRARLHQLGLATLGQLRALPGDALTDRFGEGVHHLHRALTGTDPRLAVSDPIAPLLVSEMHLDLPETESTRLLFRLKRHISPLFERVARRGQKVSRLRLTLRLFGGRTRELVVTPAEPTDDETRLVELLRLQLDRTELPGGVEGALVVADGERVTPAQLALLDRGRALELPRAREAAAQVAAELGDARVGVLALSDGHLPEARWRFEATTALRSPAPRSRRPRLVRRILGTPAALPPRPRHEPDGWLVDGLAAGPVERADGPWIVSGGWWAREIHREYWFVETRRGDLLWVFHDRRRRAWYRHGEVD